MKGFVYLSNFLSDGEISLPNRVEVSIYDISNMKHKHDRVIDDSDIMTLGLRLAVAIALFVLRGERRNHKLDIMTIQSADLHCQWAVIGVRYLSSPKYNDNDIMACASVFLECGEIDKYKGTYRVWIDTGKEFWR